MPVARAAAMAAMKDSSEQVSGKASAGPPMTKRVWSASGVCTETVKLGISARRRRVSSALDISFIVARRILGEIRISRLPARGHRLLPRFGAQQPAGVVSTPQGDLRDEGQAADAPAGAGGQYERGRVCA